MSIQIAPPRNFGLEGRTALITGASRNIGLAIASAYAHAGARLILVARGANQLEAVAIAIRSATSADVSTIVADVAAPEGIQSVIRGAAAESVDILVNNAHTVGSSSPTALLDVEESVWEAVIATNLFAPFRLTQHFGRAMAERGSGCIVNLVSGSGLQPSPGLGAYGASKAALWMMTRSLAAELAPSVRVNALCPGLVSEDGLPRNDPQSKLLTSVPMGRMAVPDEVSGAALFLASDEASYTTGEMLIVNGGRPW